MYLSSFKSTDMRFVLCLFHQKLPTLFQRTRWIHMSRVLVSDYLYTPPAVHRHDYACDEPAFLARELSDHVGDVLFECAWVALVSQLSSILRAQRKRERG